MGNGNESTCWGKIGRSLADPFVQTFVFLIINLIFFTNFYTQDIFELLREHLNPIITVTDVIAILTVFVLASGVLYYVGFFIKTQKDYRLKRGAFDFKYQIAIMGAGFVSSIFLSIIISPIIKQIAQSNKIPVTNGLIIFILELLFLVFILNKFILKRDNTKYSIASFLITISIFTALMYITMYIVPEQLIFLWYVIVICLLIIIFGYSVEKYSDKNKNLTLKMVTFSRNGRQKLVIKEKMELFDITKESYHFKDSEENEFIIPIGQVQEIIYETHRINKGVIMSKLEKDEEKILYHIYKKKYMINYRPFRISELLSELISEYNANDTINIIKSLVSKGFILVKTNGTTLPVDDAQKFLTGNPEVVERIPLELCAPNVEKITEIKKLLRCRRGINWLKENIILTWQFIWKHFIVTIIVSALTTYIIQNT